MEILDKIKDYEKEYGTEIKAVIYSNGEIQFMKSSTEKVLKTYYSLENGR